MPEIAPAGLIAGAPEREPEAAYHRADKVIHQIVGLLAVA
jgi:hypothetical protein